ncbi:MAG TPA: VC0807 family protein [Caulobacteraceae bacterium]
MTSETTSAPSKGALALAWLRKNGASFATEGLINFILPIVIFDLAKPHWGDVRALIASSAPPIVWSLGLLAIKRRVDAVSMLVLAGIALSLLAVLGGGSVRFLQLREKLVTVTIGTAFVVSAAIRKPLIYYLARATIMRRSASEAEEFIALRDNPHFRRTMTVMTLAWGFGLICEAAVATALVLNLSVHDYLIAGPILGYSTVGALSLWSFLYVRRARRRGEARRAAEATAKTAST